MNQIANGLIEVANLHTTLLVNLDSIASGTSSGYPGQQTLVQPVPTIRRPWLDPPEGYAPFDYQFGINLPVLGGGGGSSGFVVLVSLLVPVGMDGVINGISCNFTGGGFVEFSGDIVWQIVRNGAPVRGFDNILNEKGTLEIARPISPIRIYSTQLVQLLVNHAANAALNGQVVGCFQGYYYPSKS